MPLINRSDKASGGRGFADGAVALASEVNADFDYVYTLVNGVLDSENIASLNWSKLIGDKELADINDISEDADEQETDQSPGTQGADGGGDETLATNLEDEIQQLRYTVKRIATGISAVRENGGTAAEPVSWIEAPARGSNLIANPRFDATSNGILPYDWGKVNTPSAFSASGGVYGDSRLEIVADAINEGAQQVVTGLKASTRYLITVFCTSRGGSTISTTGAEAGSEWDDLSIEVATDLTDTYEYFSGVVQTDASGSDITLKILSDGAAEIRIKEASMREISEAHIAPRHVHDYKEDEPDTSDKILTTSWDVVTGAINVTPPSLGYAVRVRATLTLTALSDREEGILYLAITKGGTRQIEDVTRVPANDSGSHEARAYTKSLEWVDMAPGVSSVNYQLQAKAVNPVDSTAPDNWTVEDSGNVGTRISMELIPMRLE